MTRDKRPRRIVVLALPAAVIAAGGIVVATRQPSAAAVGAAQAQAARGTVRRWVAAVANNNATVACALLTTSAQADLHPGSVGTCPATVAATYTSMDRLQTLALRAPFVGAVHLDGDKGWISSGEITTADGPGVGFLADVDRIQLQRFPDGWRITHLIARTGPPPLTA